MQIVNFPQNDRNKTIYHMQTELSLLRKMIQREKRQMVKTITQWENRADQLEQRIKERREELAS